MHHSSTGTRLELARLLADIEPGTHVYTCGPEALNEAVRSEAARLDIAADTLHFEQFAIEDKTGDAFTLVLARSGKEFVVPEEMTILQVIENIKPRKWNVYVVKGYAEPAKQQYWKVKLTIGISILAMKSVPASKVC